MLGVRITMNGVNSSQLSKNDEDQILMAREYKATK